MKIEEAIEKVKIAFGYSTSIHEDWKPHQEACNLAIAALEKQIAKKPVWVVDVFECPCCGEDLGNTDNTEYYCWNCGQKLDWGNEE